MLVLNEFPVLTYLDLYENFDMMQILSQPEAFLAFAKGHLRFTETNEKCIRLFEKALHSEKALRCGCSADFWQNEDKPDESISMRSLRDVIYMFFSSKMSKNVENWQNLFVMATAAHILAKHDDFVPPKETVIAATAAATGADGTIDLSQEVLSASQVTLIPGNTYSLQSSPALRADEPLALRIVKFSAANGYTGTAKLKLHGGKTTELELPKGHFVYAIVSGSTVTKILPDASTSARGTVCRDFTNNTINHVDARTDIPFDAVAFICVDDHTYMYIDVNGLRLRCIGKNAQNHMLPQFLRKAWVDLTVSNGSYYLLDSAGIAKNSNGTTPENMRAYFGSLQV